MVCGGKSNLSNFLSIFLLAFIGFSWLTLNSSEAQFIDTGGNIGGNTSNQFSSGDRVRDRMNRKKTGANIQEWVRRLGNDRPETRLEAVKSLGDSKDPKAIEHLMNATADLDIRVKIKAIDYLGNLKATDATPILVQQLFLRNVGMGVKQKVLVALGKIGDPRGAEPIMEFLKRRLDPHTKGTALFALRGVGNDSILPFLDNLAHTEQSQPLRRLAVEAAEDIRHRLSPEFSPVVPTFIKQVELRNKAEKGEEAE